MLGQIRRFGIVGILATTVHVFVAYLVVSLTGSLPQLANLFGFLCAFLVSYFGHLHYTFQPEFASDSYFRRFLILSGLSFLTSASIVYFLTNTLGLDFRWALAAMAVIVPGISFIVAKFWAFSAPEQDESAGYGSYVLMALMFQIIGYFWFQSFADLNHDTAWYLIATQKWLDGARLYTDIIEVNPPLGFYWTVPAIWLSKLTALDKQLSLLVFIGLLSTISFISVWDSIKRIPALTTVQKLLLTELVLLAVLWFTTPQVGQREHILILCFLPYVFIVLAEAHGINFSKKYRAVLALLALSGILLKPHFVMLPLMIALFECIMARSVRPFFKLENWIIGIGCLLYLLFVYLVHPEYFNFLLPIAFTVYGAIGGTADQVYTGIPVFIIALLVFVLALGAYQKTLTKGLLFLAAAALGGAASYYLQFTGFRYHSYPFYICTFLFYAFILMTTKNRRTLFYFAFAGLLASLHFGPKPVRYHNVANIDLLQEMDTAAKGSTVLMLSTNVFAGFPITLSQEWVWASRFPHQWLLPGALANVANLDCAVTPVQCEKNNAILDYARNANLEDIKKHRPDFIILDSRTNKSYITDESFDYIKFMSQDPRFAALWASYKQTAKTKYFTIWAK